MKITSFTAKSSGQSKGGGTYSASICVPVFEYDGKDKGTKENFEKSNSFYRDFASALSKSPEGESTSDNISISTEFTVTYADPAVISIFFVTKKYKNGILCAMICESHNIDPQNIVFLRADDMSSGASKLVKKAGAASRDDWYVKGGKITAFRCDFAFTGEKVRRSAERDFVKEYRTEASPSPSPRNVFSAKKTKS